MLLNNVLSSQHISGYQLSKLTGIPYMTINNLINGVTPITRCESGTLYSIASCLHVPMEELLQSWIDRDKKRIPEELAPYFWDTDIQRLSVTGNQGFIIPRLLTKGGTEGYLYVVSTYSPEEIQRAVSRSRDLSPIVAAYYRRIFRLKKEDMNYYRMGADEGWR